MKVVFYNSKIFGLVNWEGCDELKFIMQRLIKCIVYFMSNLI